MTCNRLHVMGPLMHTMGPLREVLASPVNLWLQAAGLLVPARCKRLHLVRPPRTGRAFEVITLAVGAEVKPVARAPGPEQGHVHRRGRRASGDLHLPKHEVHARALEAIWGTPRRPRPSWTSGLVRWIARRPDLMMPVSYPFLRVPGSL